MDFISEPPSTHPLARAVAGLGSVLDEVETSTPAGLSVEAKATILVDLTRQIERAQGLKLSLMAGCEDVAAERAARDIASWLAPRVQADNAPTRVLQHLAEAVEARWRRVGAALRGGGCNLEQAKVIVRCLDDLPAHELEPELLAKAEAHMVSEALHFTPKELRQLGDRLLETIAPDVHEDAERKKLDRELKAGRRQTRLNFKNRGDGTTDITARVPDSVAQRFRAALDAWTSPRHQTSAASSALDGISHIDPATGERLPAERLRGHAFAAMLEHLNPAQMPLHGGTPTSVNVTISLDALRSGLGVGVLDDGSHIPVGEVRRLACTAGIIPVVLGGTSEILDLGRSRRLFTGAQKRAMAIGHPTCRAEGCTIPAPWCEAHHFAEPWAQNGRTDLKDGKLLCNFHHHKAHDDRYVTSELPNGDVRYSRRS